MWKNRLILSQDGNKISQAATFYMRLGKRAEGLIFPLIHSSLWRSTQKKKSNTQKVKVHMPPYKILLCIVYLSIIFPAWKKLTSFNLQSLPYVQCLRVFYCTPLSCSHRIWCCSWGMTHIKHSKMIIFHDYRLKSCNIYLFGMTLHCNTLQTNEPATSRPFLQGWYLATYSPFYYRLVFFSSFPSVVLCICWLFPFPTYYDQRITISLWNFFQPYPASFDQAATAPTVYFINRFKVHSEFNLWE